MGIGMGRDIQNADDYKLALQSVKERVLEAQHAALKAVNRELILLYRDIGRIIVEKQAQYGWGDGIVEQLARDLQTEFPGVRGFSRRNIFYMRSFYLAYKDNEKVQTVSAQIPWSHNTLILDRCKDMEARIYHIRNAAELHLSYRALERKVRDGDYGRYLLNQTNFGQTLAPSDLEHALLAVKDDYNLDFLGLGDVHTERQLEDALVANITKLLSEMGGYFTFAGRQFRVEVDNDEYFIDLLFYHRQLRSLVAVELKAGKFLPEYAGKMQFYLSALDDKVRLPDENPSIGIIVCRSKDRTVVEYTLRDVSRPIGIASYNHYASLADLPDRISKYLPSPQEIEMRLSMPEPEDEEETEA
jgi:predicted nuclease of restriction endonuclease-like (RecB) superfamily